jgi:hypothetical protein
MIKRRIFILLLISLICTPAFSQTIGLAFCGYIEAPEDVKVDNDLDFTSIRLQFYNASEWGLRMGGFISVLMSSRDIIEDENQLLYGNVSAGILLGQELKVWLITLGINGFLGVGFSISNLQSSPRHIDFFSEISIDLGFMLMEGFSLSGFGGFQCIGNLFPEVPGTDYLMYYPVWGILLIW